jgi:hypothetical protein
MTERSGFLPIARKHRGEGVASRMIRKPEDLPTIELIDVVPSGRGALRSPPFPSASPGSHLPRRIASGQRRMIPVLRFRVGAGIFSWFRR